ncbi:exosome complex component RRP43, partial [Tremellales sp. Uapishka_1]
MAATMSQQPVASTSSIPESPTQPSAAAAAATFKRLHPTQYLSRFLAQGYRPDGREVLGWRDVSVNVGSISTSDGSSLVRMGDTTIVCGIKAEIAEPSMSTPTHGYLVPNVDLPALCSPKFKPGPPGDEAQTLSNQMNDLLVSAITIPPSSLCIEPGKAVWTLYIDAVCINYDGNAFDAVVLAVIAALRNTRLPKATYDPDTGRTLCSREDMGSLELGRIPLSCSFGIFESQVFISASVVPLA